MWANPRLRERVLEEVDARTLLRLSRHVGPEGLRLLVLARFAESLGFASLYQWAWDGNFRKSVSLESSSCFFRVSALKSRRVAF